MTLSHRDRTLLERILPKKGISLKTLPPSSCMPIPPSTTTIFLLHTFWESQVSQCFPNLDKCYTSWHLLLKEYTSSELYLSVLQWVLEDTGNNYTYILSFIFSSSNNLYLNTTLFSISLFPFLQKNLLSPTLYPIWIFNIPLYFSIH